MSIVWTNSVVEIVAQVDALAVKVAKTDAATAKKLEKISADLTEISTATIVWGE